MATIRIHPPLLWTAATILPSVCTAIVAARFVARRKTNAECGMDDWMVIPALVLVWGMGVTIMVGTAQHSLGYPTPPAPAGEVLTTASPEQIIAEKCFDAITLLQTASVTFTKLSLMLFYRRIFRLGSHKVVGILIHVLNSLIVLWGISFFFSFLFVCRDKPWHLWSTTADALTCPSNLVQINLSLAISGVILDSLVMIFPIPLIARLHLSRTKKFAISGIFLLGAAAISMSITRLVIIVEELNVYVSSTADEDFTSTAGLYFIHLEGCTALIAVCLPSIAGLFKIKGVQAFFGGILSYFNSLSAGSSRRPSAPPHANFSHGDREAWLKAQGQGPGSSQTCLRNGSAANQGGIELQPLPRDAITVTNTIEQRFDNA